MRTLAPAEALDRLCALAQSGAGRRLIALAGVPGAGKSTLARQWAVEVNRRVGADTMIALGMDGFHLPKTELARMPNAAEALARRGAPWTFDPAGFAGHLARIRTTAGMEWSAWPDFEHGTGDPVPRERVVSPGTQVVLVEGLYVLHREDGWADAAAAFDERWFLETPLAQAMQRLAARHMASWKMSAEQAEARIASNDRLNAEIVLASRRHAEWVVEG